jgi:hypothetical protein
MESGAEPNGIKPNGYLSSKATVIGCWYLLSIDKDDNPEYPFVKALRG